MRRQIERKKIHTSFLVDEDFLLISHSSSRAAACRWHVDGWEMQLMEFLLSKISFSFAKCMRNPPFTSRDQIKTSKNDGKTLLSNFLLLNSIIKSFDNVFTAFNSLIYSLPPLLRSFDASTFIHVCRRSYGETFHLKCSLGSDFLSLIYWIYRRNAPLFSLVSPT